MPTYKLTKKDLVGPFEGMPLGLAQLTCDRAVEFRGYITLQEIKEFNGIDGLFKWSTTPEGVIFWDNISKGNYSPYYEKYHNKSPTKYQVKESDLIGDLEGFPIEVVQKMIERQVEQHNKADITSFQKHISNSKTEGGFTWVDTIEGHSFWADIILYRNFKTFFEVYPITEQLNKRTTSKEPIDSKDDSKKFTLKISKLKIEPKIDTCKLQINCNNHISLNFKN